MSEEYNENGHGAAANLVNMVIPPNPNEKFFNCRKTNQNALIGDRFWIIDFHDKTVERDEKSSLKYVLLCKRSLDESDEKEFKFFTGSPQIKYKLDYLRAGNNLPASVKLVGDGRNFDIVDIMVLRR
jgi:hypothetical protein